MKSIMLLAALTLAGCAGSPLHNGMAGNGFTCTMPACASDRTHPSVREQANTRSADAVSRIMQTEHERLSREIQNTIDEAKAARRKYEEALSPPPAQNINLPKNYQHQVKAWAETGLKDPFSAKYKFGESYVGYIANIKPKQSTPAVFVFVMINAKNTYGGYTGYEIYRCAITDSVGPAQCHTYTPPTWKF